MKSKVHQSVKRASVRIALIVIVKRILCKRSNLFLKDSLICFNSLE